MSVPCPNCGGTATSGISADDVHVRSRKTPAHVVILRVPCPMWTCACGLIFTDQAGERIRNHAASLFWWFEENVAEVIAVEKDCDRDGQ